MLEIHSTADSEIKLLFERGKVKNLRKKERLLKIASTQQTPKKDEWDEVEMFMK